MKAEKFSNPFVSILLGINVRTSICVFHEPDLSVLVTVMSMFSSANSQETLQQKVDH